MKMPASGPVYQPTTVSYEQQNEWSRPGSYLSQTVTNGFRNRRCIQWLLLAFALFSFGAGLIIMIEGTIDFSDNIQTQLEDENGEKRQKDSSSSRLFLTCVGAIMVVVGIASFIIYARILIRRKECPCYPSKEERLAMHLDAQGANGQMNPSTDLLVTAQYGPVSEIAYQPPPGVPLHHQDDTEETRQLMPPTGGSAAQHRHSSVALDGKTGTDETGAAKKAPLADAELTTPSLSPSDMSLASSYAYYSSSSPSLTLTSSTISLQNC